MSAFFTPRQVAERWQCSPEHVQRLAARGELQALKAGKRGWRISPEALAAYEQRQTTASGSSTPDEGQKPAPPKEVRPPAVIDGFTLPADYTPRFPQAWIAAAPTKKATPVRS